MDYFDEAPAKVNRRKFLFLRIKDLRKAERKARKARKAQRMAELLVEQEKQRELDDRFKEIYEKERLKKREKFEVRDHFNWDEFNNDSNEDEES